MAWLSGIVGLQHRVDTLANPSSHADALKVAPIGQSEQAALFPSAIPSTGRLARKRQRGSRACKNDIAWPSEFLAAFRSVGRRVVQAAAVRLDTLLSVHEIERDTGVLKGVRAALESHKWQNLLCSLVLYPGTQIQKSSTTR
jgi:hypothetical protein